MKNFHHRFLFLTLTFLFIIGSNLIPFSYATTIEKSDTNTANISPGQIFYSPMLSTTAYLIDEYGNVNHTWHSSYTPGCAAYLLDNGTILRTARKGTAPFGGVGGGLQKITWDDTIIWDFTYYTSDVLSHHDVEPLPNGNVLMIAWEEFTLSEAFQAGRDPNFMQGSYLMADHIIEVKQTGPTTGDIVWEWHAFDHLIQDYDPAKDNYGVVADHPELIDINCGSSQTDWMHTNSVDYNEELDQILISVNTFSEIWVIDHSTTTQEAAGHTGGNSGKGGDLLYRWGNPRAYDHGTTANQKFFSQHDATWVEPGRPGEGNIMVFNNGQGRPQGRYSSVDEIVPPVDQNGLYTYTAGTAYGPQSQVWIYTADNPLTFYGSYLSGAERLPNGNTLICNGPAGEFFEVTPEKVTVWEFTNPYPNYFNNNVFKINYYLEDEPNPEIPDLDAEGEITFTNVKPGEVVSSSFNLYNIGGNGSELDWIVSEWPIWGDWWITPESGEGLTPEDGVLAINVTIEAPLKEDHEFTGVIRIENQDDPDDFDVIPITLITPINQNAESSIIERIFEFVFQRMQTLTINLFLFLNAIL